MTLKFREVNRDTFDAIRDGVKKIETRAASEKYQDIKAGDIITFVCGDDRFERKIMTVKKFTSIDSLLAQYQPWEINPKKKSKKEIFEMYYSFPDYQEKIKLFGLVAIGLE